MRNKPICLAILAFLCCAVHAESPRLSLKISSPIGATNGSHCVDDAPSVPARSNGLDLTEQDVVGWDQKTSTWTLDPERFAGSEGGWKIADRCYELAIDGKVLSKGLVLWTHSPRLTGFDTLIVTNANASLQLQLLSGNHGRNVRLIHRDALNQALGSKSRLAQ